MAVAYALIIGLFVTRGLKWRDILPVFIKSGVVTAAVLLIVSMASIFSWILTILQIPQTIAATIGSMTSSPSVVVILLAVFVLICGLVIDTLPALIILVPVLGPLSDQFGLDPMYFAIMIVLNLTIGMITPPVGPVLFVVSTVGRVRLETLSRTILPLLIAELFILGLVIAFPFLSTALPKLLGITH